jgi:hypothetical protein
MKEKQLSDFDLSTRSGRHQARKYGFNVEKFKPGKIAKDVWDYVDKKESCWLWTGGLNWDGYGQYAKNGVMHRAHRYIWEITKNKMIGNKIVMHICDTPNCVNPDHLVLGTHADNVADKIKKNRQAKGEKCPISILTESQVIEIRKKYKYRVCTYKMLADEYGVCKDTIQKAVRKINWGHVE